MPSMDETRALPIPSSDSILDNSGGEDIGKGRNTQFPTQALTSIIILIRDSKITGLGDSAKHKSRISNLVISKSSILKSYSTWTISTAIPIFIATDTAAAAIFPCVPISSLIFAFGRNTQSVIQYPIVRNTNATMT